MTNTYVLLENNQEIILTEEEWNALMGEDDYGDYVFKVYRGFIGIEEVPEELQEKVNIVINNKIAHWGIYQNRQISSGELQNLIETII